MLVLLVVTSLVVNHFPFRQLSQLLDVDTLLLPSGSHHSSSDLIGQVHEPKDFNSNQSEYRLTELSDGERLFGHDGDGHRKDATKGKCQKYILLTTQRSGSTWTCTLFNVQNKITCGGETLRGFSDRRRAELLIEYSRITKEEAANVEWSDYKKDLLKALDTATNVNDQCGDHGSSDASSGSAAAGFKLMYDQIPYQFIEGRQFQNFLREHDVAIVHLVRDAKILTMASKYNNRKQFSSLKTMHTNNAKQAEEFRNTADKMPWDKRIIRDVVQNEKVSDDWDRIMSSEPLVRSHRVSYEKLLQEQDRRDQIAQIISFLLPYSSGSVHDVQVNTSLLQLHEPTCSSRVAKYSAFRAHPDIANTKTATACDLIEYHFGSSSKSDAK